MRRDVQSHGITLMLEFQVRFRYEISNVQEPPVPSSCWQTTDIYGLSMFERCKAPLKVTPARLRQRAVPRLKLGVHPASEASRNFLYPLHFLASGGSTGKFRMRKQRNIVKTSCIIHKHFFSFCPNAAVRLPLQRTNYLIISLTSMPSTTAICT